MGTGHYIRNTEQSLLRVLIGFNNGRYEANDLSAWIASNPVDVLATNLGLPRDIAAKLPRRTHFMVPAKSTHLEN
jgi:oxalate decarboxylase